MNLPPFSIFSASMLTFLLLFSTAAFAGPAQDHVVRIAEIQIDPAQLDGYKSALKEEIETSIRVEPGVLTLYAVALKDNPASIRILEVYANVAAYNAHLQAPHFQKYKSITKNMVKSLKLAETDPIMLGSKNNPAPPSDR